MIKVTNQNSTVIGLPEFDGTLIYKNGDIFMGLFRDGRRYDGTLIFANGGDQIERK
jgi:hypothetical protein